MNRSVILSPSAVHYGARSQLMFAPPLPDEEISTRLEVSGLDIFFFGQKATPSTGEGVKLVSCSLKMSRDPKQWYLLGTDSLVIRTGTDDSDSQAIATFEEKVAHATLSSSSKRGWLSTGILVFLSCCLDNTCQHTFLRSVP